MDLLEHIFQASGLKRRLLDQRSFETSTSLEFPCNKSFGFHVVTSGTASVHVNNKKIFELNKGDIALMSRGCHHVIKQSQAKLTLVSGAYQFWNEPIHPFFKEIPDWFVIKADEIESFSGLQMSMNLLLQEISKPQVGSERIVQSLLDVIFSMILRKVVEMKSLETQTWSHALQDQAIRHSLELMHLDIKKEWSVETLAKQVGLSRAGFALKFKKSLGDTPLHYLTGLRMQKAMELLADTTQNIESVADAVGYKDPFGFSKVFKKVVGLPPKDFRKKNIEDKKLDWRFS